MRVGAFELEKKIGAGGMGEIWMARHVEQGVPAAVKFDLHAPDDTWREAFLAEVRRIAELDHPNVVHLFDTGLVTAAERDLAEGVLAEGMPWLAMELARGGAIADSGNMPVDWEELLHVAVGLLRALAHSHARGIVHRDIKPGNLLLAGARSSLVGKPDSVRSARIVLSDFGIGHDRDRPGWMDEQSVGTPRFMAPEQIEANWRDQGAWTDLYQTGILLWRLATGSYPFAQKKAVQLYRAHLFEAVPGFEPAMDVPSGLESILRWMLEKDWRARPSSAADVVERLEALGAAVVGSAVSQPIMEIEEAPTEISEPATDRNTRSYLGPQSSIVLDMGLRGAGLGLWGLKPPPLVGRDTEREALWSAFVDVRKSGRPSARVLQGAEGVGKTRLANTLGELVVEKGVGRVLWVRHTEDPSVGHGLPGMFRRVLRLDGLERDEAVERIQERVPLDAGHDLLIPWVLGQEHPSDRLPTASEQLALLRHALAHWSREKPVVVVIDDAHFGAMALRLVGALLQRVRHLPVFFLFCLRDSELHDRPEETRRLAALLDHGRAESLSVGPLTERATRSLVRKMLGLEGELAVEVERRASGNPAFAVQLVNHWVQQGQLIVGNRGFRLRGGIPDELPGDLLSVWTEQIEELGTTSSQDDVDSLEILALLGMGTTYRSWHEACARGGLFLRQGWAVELVQRRLLRSDARMERVRFSHVGIREALLRRLEASGRRPARAAWVADYLSEQTPIPSGAVAELLLWAGQPDRAAVHLLEAMEDSLSQGDLRSSRWLDRLEAVLSELPAPPEDERWGMLWLNWAWFHRLQGHSDRADNFAATAERLARRHHWTSVLGWSLREAGSTAFDRSEFEDAITWFQQAETLLEEAGRPESAAWCRNKLAAAFDVVGDYELAEAAYRSCIDVFDADAKGWTYAASPWLGLAQLLQKQGRLEEASEHAEEARWRAERVGQHTMLAHIEMVKGEVARYRGQLDVAEVHYRSSVERYDAFHDPTVVVPTLNLGVVGVLREQFEETRALMDSLLGRVRDQPLFMAYTHAVLVACCAALDDIDGFLSSYDPLLAFLDQTGVADPDIVKLAKIAVDRATAEEMKALAQHLVDDQEARLRPTPSEGQPTRETE